MEGRAEAKPAAQSMGRRLALFAAPVVLAGVVVVGALASRDEAPRSQQVEAQASFKPYVPTPRVEAPPTPEVKPVEQPAAAVKPAAPERPVMPVPVEPPKKSPGQQRFEEQAARLNAMRPYLHKNGERPPARVPEVAPEDLALRKRVMRGNPLYKSPIFNRRTTIKQRELLRRFNDPNHTMGSAKQITIEDLYAKNPQAIQQLRDEKRAKIVQIKRGGSK